MNKKEEEKKIVYTIHIRNIHKHKSIASVAWRSSKAMESNVMPTKSVAKVFIYLYQFEFAEEKQIFSEENYSQSSKHERKRARERNEEKKK